jgi:hypothetical protein
MIVACAAEVRGRCLWEGDTSNKPFEWTGHHKLLATPPQASCLPLKGSVSQSRGTRGCRERGYNVSTSAGCGRGSSKTGQNWQLERGPSRQAAP